MALCALPLLLASPVFFQASLGVLGGPANGEDVRIGFDGLFRTLWAPLLIALLATALALPAAWWMRRIPAAAACAALAPLWIPSYLVYASWGLLRAPGTVLGDLVATSPAWVSRVAANVQAIGGLALWIWPLSAIVLCFWTRRAEQESIDALYVSGVSRTRRFLELLKLVRGGLAASMTIVALVMLGSAIPLHVAQLETYSLAIWRLRDQSGDSPAVWVLVAPLILVAIAGGWIIGRVASRPPADRAERTPPSPTEFTTKWLATGVWSLSVLIPLIILIASLRDLSSVARFWRVSGGAVVTSAGTAIVVGLFVGAVCVYTSIAIARGVGIRARSVVVTAWAALALCPGVIIGAAIAATGTRIDSLDWLIDTHAGVIAAHFARFGFIGVGAAVFMSAVEPAELRDVRALHTGSPTRAWLLSVAPAQAIGFVAAGLAGAALSMHEIESAVVLLPPGADNLARHLLNLLHYNRDEELTAACVWMLVFGLGAGAIVVGASRVQIRRLTGPSSLAVMTLLVALPGCDRIAPAEGRIDVLATIGEPGLSLGQFYVPRAIDAGDGALWVVDRSGRVQRIDPDRGDTTAWEMPKYDDGYPCGVTFGPDGNLYVADTHEHRVVVFRPTVSGAEIEAMFGEYGKGDGQFIYPTDVAFQTNPDGEIHRIFVSEYGGNDRISVFDPDHQFLYSFGREGSGAGIEFARPQSILFDDARDELLVIDAINHRVGRFTPEGELLAWLGAGNALPGGGLGEYRYPYGCDLLADGTVLVVEFGNNRIQRIAWETGEGLGAWGVAGRAVGELAQPWAIAVLRDRAYVADSGNHRVVAFRAPRDTEKRSIQR